MTNARRHIGGWLEQSSVFSAVTRKLDTAHTKNHLKWLLEGGTDDKRRIGAHMGMAPMLLHRLSQITHFCAKLAEVGFYAIEEPHCLIFRQDPTSDVYPKAVEFIMNEIKTFHQWSELSPDYRYESKQQLLDSCILDEDGRVTDAARATLLGAEAHAASIRIYLHCRFLRKPRQHPDVRAELRTLLRCLDMLPSSGNLFTAQSPFFGVCMAGFVAYRPVDREIVRQWFLVVVDGARGNVPPAWSAIQSLWKWHDSQDQVTWVGDHVPIYLRPAWWEDMVEEFWRCEGILTYT